MRNLVKRNSGVFFFFVVHLLPTDYPLFIIKYIRRLWSVDSISLSYSASKLSLPSPNPALYVESILRL